MEFYQVGPAVMKPKIQFIIHSHMWKLQPKLTNIKGQEFLSNYCPQGVTPAEVLSAKTMSYPFSVRTVAKYLDIAIFKELMSGRGTASDGIYFDVTHVGKPELMRRAPITYETIKKAGVDLAKEKIELGLVAQNFNGGILIDETGFTGVAGLFAAGEASGGVHGADRPGGNNLIDTQVFGCRSGQAAGDSARDVKGKQAVQFDSRKILEITANSARDMEIMKASADLYYRELTIVRTAEGLKKVLKFIDDIKGRVTNIVLQNRLLVGHVLALAALTRKESRGTHYREDFPDSDSKWNQRVVISQGTNGEPVVTIQK
jgi:succinate dehydrogenase/fumarate reductase flavoprotein subunit